MSDLLPPEAWDYDDKETHRLIELIDKIISKEGVHVVFEKIIFELDPYKHEYCDASQRILKCLTEIKSEGRLQSYYKNDVARAIVSCLKKPKKNKHGKMGKKPLLTGVEDKGLAKTTRHNALSYNSSRQYDPTKNGINFLKHGIYFDYVLSGKEIEFGRLITHSFVNNQKRDVVFSKITNNETKRYVVSIMVMSPTPKNFSKNEMDKKTKVLSEQVCCEICNNKEINAVNNFDVHKVRSVISQFNDVKSWQSKSQPMTFISSWLFDSDNFEKTIKDRIRDNNLDEKVIEWLKERAFEILDAAWR